MSFRDGGFPENRIYIIGEPSRRKSIMWQLTEVNGRKNI